MRNGTRFRFHTKRLPEVLMYFHKIPPGFPNDPLKFWLQALKGPYLQSVSEHDKSPTNVNNLISSLINSPGFGIIQFLANIEFPSNILNQTVCVKFFWVRYLRTFLLSDLQNCCWLSKTNISILHPRNIWKIEFIFDFWLIFYVEPFWPIPGPINIQVTFIMGFLPIFDQFLVFGEFFSSTYIEKFLIRIKAIWIPDSGKTNSCSNIF